MAPPAPLPVPCGAKELSARHRPFQHARRRALAFDRDRREDARLIEHVRLVAQRDVRERPRALQADHARADAAQRKRHLVQILAGIRAVVGAPPAAAPRAREALRRGGAGCEPCRIPRRRGAQAADRAHGRGRELRNLRRGMDESLCDSVAIVIPSVVNCARQPVYAPKPRPTQA